VRAATTIGAASAAFAAVAAITTATMLAGRVVGDDRDGRWSAEPGGRPS